MCPAITGQLRMKGGGHDILLPHHDWILAFHSQHFDPRSDSRDLRSPDENHFDGRSLEGALSNGTINLAAVSVAANSDINCAETSLFRVVYFLGEKDRTGASPESWFQSNELFQLPDPSLAQQLQKCARFAARDDQTVN